MGNTAPHKMPKETEDSPEWDNPYSISDDSNQSWNTEPLVRICILMSFLLTGFGPVIGITSLCC